MNDTMRLSEAIEESSPVKVSLSILGVILAGIVTDWMLTPFPVKWITPLVAVFCYLGSIAVNFMKAEAEEKGYKVEEAKTKANEAIAYAKQCKHQIVEANKLIAELKAKAVDIKKLSTAQRDLSTVRQELSVARQKLSVAEQELSVERNNSSTCLDKLSTQEKALSTAESTVKNQRQLIKQLTPYQVLWEQYKLYKASESIAKRSDISEQERAEAREQRDKAKGEMAKAIDEGL